MLPLPDRDALAPATRQALADLNAQALQVMITMLRPGALPRSFALLGEVGDALRQFMAVQRAYAALGEAGPLGHETRAHFKAHQSTRQGQSTQIAAVAFVGESHESSRDSQDLRRLPRKSETRSSARMRTVRHRRFVFLQGHRRSCRCCRCPTAMRSPPRPARRSPI